MLSSFMKAVPKKRLSPRKSLFSKQSSDLHPDRQRFFVDGRDVVSFLYGRRPTWQPLHATCHYTFRNVTPKESIMGLAPGTRPNATLKSESELKLLSREGPHLVDSAFASGARSRTCCTNVTPRSPICALHM